MSAILKGLLQPAIQGVLTSFGNDASGYIGPPSSTAAEAAFADRLSTAIATAVQAYLVANVTTVPAPGPVSHVHKILAP